MSQCCAAVKQEFRLKHFGFSDVNPLRFVNFQWRAPPLLYILYRLVLAIYVDFWLIYTTTKFVGFGTEDVNDGKDEADLASSTNSTLLTNMTNSTKFELYSWPVYLTNWTYTLLCLYMTVHLATATFFLGSHHDRIPLYSRPRHTFHKRLFSELRRSPSLWENEQEITAYSNDPMLSTDCCILPWYFKLTWILYNAANTACILVTVVFFVFLWPMFDTSGIGLMNLQLHGINTLIIFIEFCVTAVPYRLYHYIYPLIYGLAYLIFSAIFYAAGNKSPIYPEVLDWESPGQTVAMCLVLGFVFMPIVQLILFGLYELRLFIFDVTTRNYEHLDVRSEVYLEK